VGSGITPGLGTELLRRQHVLGVLLVWQAKRIARQQALSVAVLDWQACAMFSGRARTAIRRNRLRPDFL
jgi:hypothetical protein